MKFNRYFGTRKTFTHHRINIIGVMSCFLMTKTATCLGQELLVHK